MVECVFENVGKKDGISMRQKRCTSLLSYNDAIAKTQSTETEE